jgi:hypothetical protein
METISSFLSFDLITQPRFVDSSRSPYLITWSLIAKPEFFRLFPYDLWLFPKPLLPHHPSKNHPYDCGESYDETEEDEGFLRPEDTPDDNHVRQ